MKAVFTFRNNVYFNRLLSIGGNLFYFDHTHHWPMGGELGLAYTRNPKVSLTRSGSAAPIIDAAVSRQQKKPQNYADQFRWMPVVKLMVTYSF